jgi:uncharacterized protein (TIGR03083 family)
MTDPVIHQLEREWSIISTLLRGLTDEQWHTPTALPGWTVQDCVSHITGTERQMMGDDAPAVDIAHLEHVKNPFGEIVEVWVEARRSLAPAEVLAEFNEQIARRLDDLHAMSDDELAAVIPSPLGEMPYREFLKVRVFDSWMHEQDIRRAIDQPGNLDGPIVDVALERFKGALGYVVGKKAGAPDGSTIVFALEGGPGGAIALEVAGRARVVDDMPDSPTVRVVLPFEAFIALGGGRCGPEDAIAAGARLEGDEELGHRVLEALPFTP